jgi:hypothetical protein
MKKLTTLFALLFISGMIYAQGPVDFGIKVGMNLASLPTTNTDSIVSSVTTKSMYGYQAGLFLRITVKKIIIQPEVYFSLKGGDVTYDLIPDSASFVNSITKKVRLYNVDIPIMFGYSFVDNPLFKFRVLAGPVASINLDKSIDINTSGVHADLGKTDLNTVMWNIQAGLGVDLWKFTLDVRYEFGLNELNKGATEQTKSNSYMVSLGFKF